MTEEYDRQDQPSETDAAEQERETDEESEFEEEERSREERHGNARLLTTIQVVACLIVLTAALVLRFSDNTIYQKARAWYLSAFQDSLVAEEQEDQAKRVVVNFWDNLTASRSAVSENPSQAVSSQAASSQAAVSSGVNPSSRAESAKASSPSQTGGVSSAP